MRGEGTPMDDHRASAAYRSAMLGTALLKLWEVAIRCECAARPSEHPARERRAARHRRRPLHRRPRGPDQGLPARVAGAGAARACAGHRPAGRSGVRRPGRGARADRRRRAGSQRRRRQARRAAVPDRGDVPRARRLLGARRDARGGPAGCRGGGGRLRRRCPRSSKCERRSRPAASRAGGPRLPARRRRGGARRLRPRVQRRDRDGRAGALLPRDPLLPGARRRVRPGVRAEQHPAPDRDPGDRRPRARSSQPRRHRAVPADGRRVRRQGDAAARVRRGGGARRDAHRPTGAAAAQPHPGHDHDRQAARLPRAVAGGLRRRRPAAGARRHADLRRRVEPRPVRAGAGPRAVPRRQRLLDPPRAGERPSRADPQDLADRVPRVRRTAGDAGDRGRPRPVRAAPRDRPGRPAPAQPLRRRPGHAVRAAGAARAPRGDRVGPGASTAPRSRGGRAEIADVQRRPPARASEGWRSRR